MDYIQLDDYFLRSEPEWNYPESASQQIPIASKQLAQVTYLQKKVEQIDTEALFAMGFLYHRGGMGITRNYAKAVALYLKAAEAHNKMAYNNLGGMCDAGHGTEQNPVLALSYYQCACSEECPEAYFNVGALIRNGRVQDYPTSEANSWFDRARQTLLVNAKDGNASAQCRLGLLYKSTAGGFYNIDKAEYWLMLAAEQGLAEAQYQLGYCLNWFHKMKRTEEALQWFIMAAEQGHPDAQLAAWESSVSRKREDPRYLSWLIEAGNHGHDRAPFSLGCYYEQNEKSVDIEQAFYWYSKGASLGDKFSILSLGDLYLEGKGVKKDYAEALKLYLKAHSLGSGAARRITELYQKGGYGILQDLAQSNYWQTIAVREEEQEDWENQQWDMGFLF